MPQPLRKLAYRDRFLTQLTEIVDESIEPDALATFPDMETPTTLTTTWTQEQYTKILSSLEVGAALAFPEERQQIYYDFLIMTNGGGMSCEDVADCIENSEDVLAALLAQLSANGFQSIGSDVPPANMLTAADTAENLLPEGYTCSDSQVMATSRAIVTMLHNATIEFLNEIEMLTNPAEFAVAIADNVEIVSWFASVAEVAEWFQDNLIEAYEASYSQDTEDIFACAIYCAIIEECEATYDNILQAYEDGLEDIDPPEDLTDPQQVVDWLISLELTVSTKTVAAFHFFILEALRFSKPILNLLGIRTLEETIEASVGQIDNSYTLCDECPPTETPDTYWMLYLDFAISPYDMIISTNAGEYIAGAGYRSKQVAGFGIVRNLGGTFVLKAAGMDMQARGFSSQAGDSTRISGWTAAGGTGSEVLVGNTIGYTAASNINHVMVEYRDLAETVGSQSAKWSSGNVGANDYPNNFTQCNRVVLYGLPDGSGNKPEMSVWVSAIPTAPDSLFPSA